MERSPRAGIVFVVMAALAWAGTSPGLAYLMDNYPIRALTLAFWRDAFVATACLTGIGLVALVRRQTLPAVNRAELRGFALTGVISVGIYHALFVLSIALNGAALGIVLIYLYPAFVTLGARVFFREAITLRQLIALLFALVGCALLVRIYDPEVLRVSWLGVIVGIGSALTHAGYVLFNQRALDRHSPWLSLALTMAFGSLTLLLLVSVVDGPATLFQIGSGFMPWLLLLGLSLGPTLGGYALFTISLRHLPGRIASLIVVIEAPIATLAAVLLLGERIVPIQILGMVLILFAAVLPGLRLRASSPATSPA
jgi:drug/metabolite transporter (DMT)-like permease